MVSDDLSESSIDSPVPLETEIKPEDGDLAYVVSEVLPLAHRGNTARPEPAGIVHANNHPAPTEVASVELVPVVASPSRQSSNPLGVVPRWTGRVGAGQHCNVHHLPRTVGAGSVSAPDAPACGTYAVMAWFMPWK